MLAKIIVTPDISARLHQINDWLGKFNLKSPHPDVMFLPEGEKLGVAQVKEILRFLSFKPYSAKQRAVVLVSADNLTRDAQNSLLKTLEEPPGEALILLGGATTNNFLPTVLSRCEIVYSKTSSTNKNYYKEIEELLKATLAERFIYIEKLEDKEAFLLSLTQVYQLKLRREDSAMKFCQTLLEAAKWQKQNVNLRAILEYLMINLPHG